MWLITVTLVPESSEDLIDSVAKENQRDSPSSIFVSSSSSPKQSLVLSSYTQNHQNIERLYNNNSNNNRCYNIDKNNSDNRNFQSFATMPGKCLIPVFTLQKSQSRNISQSKNGDSSVELGISSQQSHTIQVS